MVEFMQKCKKAIANWHNNIKTDYLFAFYFSSLFISNFDVKKRNKLIQIIIEDKFSDFRGKGLHK